MERRGFLGGLATTLVAIVFNRAGYDYDSLARWIDDGWEIADVDGVLEAAHVKTLEYKVTVDGKMLTDCLSACPREEWYKVLVHADGKDDFDPSGVPMLTSDGHHLVKAIRHGPIIIWKRRTTS